MSNGIRVWDGSSNLIMDENSITMRVVLSTLVSISTSSQTVQTFSIDGVTPSNSVAILLPVGSYNTLNYTAYETEVVNGAVNVYNYIRGYAGTQKSLAGTMRLVVVRFA